MNFNISVLMSVYMKDDPQLLQASINSVLNQTHKPEEVLIVIDGPVSGDLISIIEDYHEKSKNLFTVIRLEENKGLGNALNIGLKHCRNELVARMDADDISCENRFLTQINEFKKDDTLSVIGSYVYDVDLYGKRLKIRKVPIENKDIHKLIWTCPIIHPTVMFKKSSILSIGNYNKNIKRRQDYELWYRASEKKLKFKNIPKPLLEYRFDENEYYIKNDFKTQFNQLRIALNGNKINKLGLYSYIGVFGNFILKISPYPIRVILNKVSNKMDPRKSENNGLS